MLKSTDDAYALLTRLGASDRLLLHLKLVGEAGEEILECLRRLNVPVNENLVRLGIAVHDAGKVLHPNEISGPGNAHEASGQKLMLEHGVQPEVARCCLSHAQYDAVDVGIEELLVALADKLWKGKRDGTLEGLVIDHIAASLEADRWSVFDILDNSFERIAADGDERLIRSRVSLQ